jgi:hypothetical protein
MCGSRGTVRRNRRRWLQLGTIGFPARVTRQYSWTSGLGGLMTQTEVEKSSRAIAERGDHDQSGTSEARGHHRRRLVSI